MPLPYEPPEPFEFPQVPQSQLNPYALQTYLQSLGLSDFLPQPGDTRAGPGIEPADTRFYSRGYEAGPPNPPHQLIAPSSVNRPDEGGIVRYDWQTGDSIQRRHEGQNKLEDQLMKWMYAQTQNQHLLTPDQRSRLARAYPYLDKLMYDTDQGMRKQAGAEPPKWIRKVQPWDEMSDVKPGSWIQDPDPLGTGHRPGPMHSQDLADMWRKARFAPPAPVHWNTPEESEAFFRGDLKEDPEFGRLSDEKALKAPWTSAESTPKDVVWQHWYSMHPQDDPARAMPRFVPDPIPRQYPGIKLQAGSFKDEFPHDLNPKGEHRALLSGVGDLTHKPYDAMKGSELEYMSQMLREHKAGYERRSNSLVPGAVDLPAGLRGPLGGAALGATTSALQDWMRGQEVKPGDVARQAGTGALAGAALEAPGALARWAPPWLAKGLSRVAPTAAGAFVGEDTANALSSALGHGVQAPGWARGLGAVAGGVLGSIPGLGQAVQAGGLAAMPLSLATEAYYGRPQDVLTHPKKQPAGRSLLDMFTKPGGPT